MRRPSPARCAKALALALTLLLLNSFSVSQSARARILGRVTDPQGAVVAGANVTVTNVQTGVESRTTTDPSGTYQVL